MNISTKLCALAAAAMVCASASAEIATKANVANARTRTFLNSNAVENVKAPRAAGNLQVSENLKAASNLLSRGTSWTDFNTGTFNTCIVDIYSKWGGKFTDVQLQTAETDDANVTNYRILNPIGFINEDDSPADDIFSPEFQLTTTEMGDIITMDAMQSTPLTLNGSGAPVLYFEVYSWYKFLLDKGLYDITQEDVDNAYGRSYFDEVQGRYIINAAYIVGEGGGDDIWKSMTTGRDYFQLDGDYPDYSYGISNPYFYNEDGQGYLNLNIQFNDNAFVVVYVENGEMEDADVQAEYQNMCQNPGDYQKFTTSGYCKIELPEEAIEGTYTYIVAAFRPDDQYSGEYGYLDCKLPEEGWTFSGPGEYQDGIICNAINSFDQVYPDGYRSEVLFEKSTTEPGAYRMIGAFAAIGQKLTQMYTNVTYDESVDVMYINVADPEKSYIEDGTTGVALDQDGEVDDIEYGCDVFENLDNPANIDDALWGKCENYVLTFPQGSADADFNALYCIMGNNTWAANQEGTFRITLPEGYVGVNNVVADQDAPVVYYNLQGQRVENAQNGLFIRTQGNKTSKVIL